VDDAIAIFCEHGFEGTSIEALLDGWASIGKASTTRSETSGVSISRHYGAEIEVDGGARGEARPFSGC
jgi:hypothetical protein